MASLDRREFLTLAGSTAAAMALSRSGWSADEEPKGRRPNVLYIFSDQHRASALGCYGDTNVRTPELDAFAQQGLRLTSATSSTPVCCPHRACLMTGQYAHHHGMLTNDADFVPKVKCLAETFKEAGYVTGYAGKWHLDYPEGGGLARRFGFPRQDRAEGLKRTRGHYVKDGANEAYQPTLLADETIQFIKEQSGKAAPWLFVLSWLPPHSPFKAPPELRKHYENDLKLPPNVDKGASYLKNKFLPDYYGLIESLDIELGRILKALKESGAADDTIVCYSSDHGDMSGAHGLCAKRFPYDNSSRVPFLIRYPRALKAGHVIADPFNTPDVYPTLAGFCGVKTPTGLDGLDYSQFFAGRAKAPRDYSYLQMHYGYVSWPGWRALRTSEYLYASTRHGPWMLYDVNKDPYELKNLVEDAGSKALVAEMEKRLGVLIKETGDSWELKCATGDQAKWASHKDKMSDQDLGGTWPGIVTDDK